MALGIEATQITVCWFRRVSATASATLSCRYLKVYFEQVLKSIKVP